MSRKWLDEVKEHLGDLPAEVDVLAGDDHACVMVSSEKVQQVAKVLISPEGLSLDWLENLMVAHLDEKEPRLMVSCLLTSRKSGKSLFLRYPVDFSGEGEWANSPSLRKFWPEAMTFEQEIVELFGVRFPEWNTAHRELLGPGFRGFPLRKTYRLLKGNA